ncbi:hypothetical protein EW145_g3900 [Phellinidium pouzarii]|uniref:Uncharacterized protein n=1 Tax=Phellinidium pouzarii TaxID=167371 RepID=A0A4S4L5H4_9AGAM|nr:hypothetical protein EW145_g3900 [Phellinidium pouzarii]
MAPSPSIPNSVFSPTLSSAASYTASSQSKLNIVSRLAIEGKAKQGPDGASIKLYLKITVPVDSVTPGQILPLFAEENVKIRDYQVHPLDADSAPYNFSSTTNPLLHNTARALNLPARSTKSVCFVLPKEFPSKSKIGVGGTDSEGDGLTPRGTPRTPYRGGRRPSIGERNSIQFMAALSLWVPFSSKPPRAPYMLSIPIPRCLSNHIKVRLPPPTSISTSFASLSSDEDSSGWDLATEPHVTRTSKHGGRMSVYNEFADDESSEASAVGTSENCMIQGTFTSSDFVRIRWASPLLMQDFPDQGDGRRRVGVAEVKSNMTCTILEKLEDGVKMRLDYQGTCTGVWFPGVATLLGMDIGLDAHGCRVSWPSDSDSQWVVDGDPALTGFTSGLPQNTLSQYDSLELPQLTVRESPDVSGLLTGETLPNGRVPSTSSASLLRAPLPNRQASAEYSFEDSMTPTTSGLPSITTSLTRSSFGLGEMSEQSVRPPSTPITIHLNMSDLVPSAKNKFIFNISGTVVLTRNLGMEDSQYSSSTLSLALPAFHVFSAETESVSASVRNLCDSANVELIESTSSLANSKNRKTIVPTGSQMRCGLEGSEILVKPISPKPTVKAEEQSFSVRNRSDSVAAATRPSSPEPASAVLRSQRSVIFRDGPLVIPWVNADVITLSPSKSSWSYAVTLGLPTPVDGPSEWLEFGLSLPSELSDPGASSLPEVEVICASVNGVPIRFETFGHTRPGSVSLSTAAMAAGLGPSSSGKPRWLSWIRVHIALAGALEVVYIVKGKPKSKMPDKEGRKKEKENRDDVIVFIPVFSIPVSRFEISLRRSSDIISNPGLLSSIDQSLYRKITTFNVEPFSQADITMPRSLFTWKEKAPSLHKNTKRVLLAFVAVLPYIFSAVLLSHMIGMRMELREMKAMVPSNWSEILPAPANVATETHTVTSTLTVTSMGKPATTPTSSERRWFGDTYTVSYSSPAKTRKAEPSSPPPPPPSPPPKKAPAEPVDDDVVVEDVSERPDETTRETSTSSGDSPPSESGSLSPKMYFPLSWPMHIHYEKAKARVMGGWGRVWRVVEIILHWPLPVDADM